MGFSVFSHRCSSFSHGFPSVSPPTSYGPLFQEGSARLQELASRLSGALEVLEERLRAVERQGDGHTTQLADLVRLRRREEGPEALEQLLGRWEEQRLRLAEELRALRGDGEAGQRQLRELLDTERRARLAEGQRLGEAASAAAQRAVATDMAAMQAAVKKHVPWPVSLAEIERMVSVEELNISI